MPERDLGPARAQTQSSSGSQSALGGCAAAFWKSLFSGSGGWCICLFCLPAQGCPGHQVDGVLARLSVYPGARAPLLHLRVTGPSPQALQRLVMPWSGGSGLTASPPSLLPIASCQAEIVKRLSGICAQIIPFLTQEVSGLGGGMGSGAGRRVGEGVWLDATGTGSAGWPGGLGTGWAGALGMEGGVLAEGGEGGSSLQPGCLGPSPGCVALG